MGTGLESVAVGHTHCFRRAGCSKGGHSSHRVEVALREQLRSIICDIVIGDAAAALMRARNHGGDELALRLHIEEGAEVDEREEVLDG